MRRYFLSLLFQHFVYVIVDFINSYGVAVLIYTNAEGRSVDVELLGKECPLLVCHIDVLAFDIVGGQPFFCRLARAFFFVTDIDEADRFVFQSFHLLTFLQ